MTLHALATLFFLGLNIFFVLTEFSLVKAQMPRLEVMRNQGNPRAALVIAMTRNLDTYLSAIQIGVTMSTLGLGWAGEHYLSRWISSVWTWPAPLQVHATIINAVLAFCVILYLQIVFAELVPRSLAIQKAEFIATWTAIPLQAYYQMFRYPIAFMARSSIFFTKLLGLPPVGEHKEVFTEDEVRVLLGMSQEKGLLPLDRLLIIENLFDLSDLEVKDAMIPREKVVYLSTAKSWDENMVTIKTNHFSRYPVGDPDLDNITGFVHLKDLSLMAAGLPELKNLIRPLQNIEDSQELQPLLKSMAGQGKHMMLVKRANKTVGLITLEDVIEELIGEILDEFDVPNAWSFNNFLHAEAIELNLQANTAQEAVRALAARLKSVVPSLDAKTVEKAVMARENQLPTALGRGVAVPHVRLAGLDKPLVAVGRLDHGIHFLAPDKRLVRLIFLVLTPISSPLEQLRIVSRIATLAHHETLLKQLMRAKSPSQFLESIKTSESILAG